MNGSGGKVTVKLRRRRLEVVVVVWRKKPAATAGIVP
jgi:hypothetical protein